MAFDWAEYLGIARYITDPESTQDPRFGVEAAIRCATSRAYYAAFCTARNYATTRLSFEGAGAASDHSGLRRHLIANNRRQLAEMLSRLQQLREQCDYEDPELVNGQQMAQDAIQQAERVLNQCR